MKRRQFLAALGLLAAPAVPPLAAPPPKVEIIYIGADDCFYCQHWEAARKPELLALIRGTGAKLVEIRGATVARPVTAKSFPPAYRWIHRAVGDVTVLPSFILVVDGRIVLKVRGTSNYSEVFAPKLQALLARARA